MTSNKCVYENAWKSRQRSMDPFGTLADLCQTPVRQCGQKRLVRVHSVSVLHVCQIQRDVVVLHFSVTACFSDVFLKKRERE